MAIKKSMKFYNTGYIDRMRGRFALKLFSLANKIDLKNPVSGDRRQPEMTQLR